MTSQAEILNPSHTNLDAPLLLVFECTIPTILNQRFGRRSPSHRIINHHSSIHHRLTLFCYHSQPICHCLMRYPCFEVPEELLFVFFDDALPLSMRCCSSVALGVSAVLLLQIYDFLHQVPLWFVDLASVRVTVSLDREG